MTDPDDTLQRLLTAPKIDGTSLNSVPTDQGVYERKFGTWRELPDGGRLYSYEVKGRFGWWARYVKEVDDEEATVRFYQEVYDGDGTLREFHHKYPIDLGHRQITGEEP